MKMEVIIPKNCKKYTNRLIPLPQEIKIGKIAKLAAGEIGIKVSGEISAPPEKTAIDLLEPFSLGGKNAKIQFNFNLLKDETDPRYKRIRELRNSSQAYEIGFTETDQGVEINLNAIAPAGLLYAAITMRQLVEAPEKITKKSTVKVPLATIVDWPDMEERGQAMNGCFKYTDTFVDWKLNLVEFTAFNGIDSDGNYTIDMDEKWLKQAEELGFRYIPYIGHLGMFGRPNQLGRLLYNEKLKHLTKILAVPDPSKPAPPTTDGLCISNPMTLDVLTNWLILIAEVTDRYNHQEMSVWLTEKTYQCHCSKCSGKNLFELETKAILKAFWKVQKKYPGKRLRIWLTQSSYPSNDKVLALLPEDVGVTYYDGGRTYCSDRNPMIYPLLEKYARKGGKLEVIPQITASWFAIIPWTAPGFVHFRLNEFVQKKLTGVYGYTVPYYLPHLFNLVAMAEWSWNAEGRTPVEFAEAYAVSRKLKHPELFAEWAVKVGEVGWTLAEVRFMEVLAQNPSRGFRPVKTHFDCLFEKTVLHNVDDLEAKIELADEALAIAEKVNDTGMILESRFVKAAIEAYKFRDFIEKKLKQKKKLTNSGKEELRRNFLNLFHRANIIRKSLYKWHDLIGFFWKDGIYERVRMPANALLLTCEIIREEFKKLNIEDPFPEGRYHSLGKWSSKDFNKGTALISIDLSGRDLEPGDHYLYLRLIQSAYTVTAMDINVCETGKKKKVLYRSKDIGACVADLSQYTPHANCRLKIPEKENLTLNIELHINHPAKEKFPDEVPENQRLCDGEINLCRIYQPEEILL